jgi:hypothetical protein
MLADSHSQKMVITKADTATYTLAKCDLICSDIKVIYWTKQQKMINTTEPKRIIFTSDYGTGKSTLLKAKALQVLKEKKEKERRNRTINSDDKMTVIFANFVDGGINLLHNQLKYDFDSWNEFVHILALDSAQSKF